MFDLKNKILDYAYTTFSGWLVASGDLRENTFSDRRDSYDRSTSCCCSRVCPVRASDPPFLRPSYNPPSPQTPSKGYGAPKPRPPASSYGAPIGRPIYNAIPQRTPKLTHHSSRPSYNSRPSYKPVPTYKPDLIPPPPPAPSPPAPPARPSIIVGRAPTELPTINQCCDSLLISGRAGGSSILLQVSFSNCIPID